MAAPNGARKTKLDHPALPMSIEETAAEASAAFNAGAAMLHAHVRDDDGKHCLDASRYRDLLTMMADQCPQMPCQITTEAVGIFTPKDQARCLAEVMPEYASIAIRELTADQSPQAMDYAAKVIKDTAAQNTHMQFILYSPEDLKILQDIRDIGQLDFALDGLFVLGKYNPNFNSDPKELDQFLNTDHGFLNSWMVCAFGPQEYDVMIKAQSNGGHARVGFENNLYLKNGDIAPSTSALVKQLAESLDPMTSLEARQLLKRPLDG